MLETWAGKSEQAAHEQPGKCRSHRDSRPSVGQGRFSEAHDISLDCDRCVYLLEVKVVVSPFLVVERLALALIFRVADLEPSEPSRHSRASRSGLEAGGKVGG